MIGRVYILIESLGAWSVVTVNSLTSHATLDGNYKFLDYGPCLQSIDFEFYDGDDMYYLVCFAFLLLVPFLMTGFLFFFCDIIDIYDVSLGDILVYFLKMILPQTSSMSTVTMEDECMLLVT